MVKQFYYIYISVPYVIKLLTAVFYCHSTVLLSFCFIEQYYHSNNNEMAINYIGILSITPGTPRANVIKIPW